MLRPKQSLFPLVLLIAALATILFVPAAMARYTLKAESSARQISLGEGDDAKDYLLVGERPTRIILQGPGEITGYARTHFGPEDGKSKLGRIVQAGIADAPKLTDFEFEGPESGQGLSRGRKFSFSVPEGEQLLELRGLAQGGGFLYLILYYEGPPQPESDRLAALIAAAQAEEAVAEEAPVSWWRNPRVAGWQLRANFGLKTAYVDNAFKYSDAFIDTYKSGSDPERFRVNKIHDVLISPRLDLELRRNIFPIGDTRLRAVYSRDEFWENPILFNHEIRFYVRQGIGRGKSFEIFYSYSPSKYLRQLNDRPPLSSDNTSVVGEEFRLTRNNLVTSYRHRFDKTFSGKLALTKSLYYYNRPHIENDLDSWELRGTLYWTLSRSWRLTLDYGYKDADARATDIAGQSKEESKASDGTHKRDYYQAALRWRPRFLKRLIDDIEVRAQYRVSYFTVQEELKVDPYHVGRKDNEYLYSITSGRGLTKKLGADFGFSYAQRRVDSPWSGDISEDKDYIVRQYWLALNYRIF